MIKKPIKKRISMWKEMKTQQTKRNEMKQKKTQIEQ